MKTAITGYSRLFAVNSRLVVFSFLMALYSSFGQTYFVGVFGPAIQAEFSLSHTAWGTIYLLGTLGSAMMMPFSGALIDRFRLSQYALCVNVLLVTACAYVSVVQGPIGLVLAIFLLRQAGQGLASHVSVTSMARYFERDRGRAIAIGAMGYTLGESLLPFVAVVLISLIGWRWTYASSAIFIGLTAIPATIWLLSRHEKFHQKHVDDISEVSQSPSAIRPAWTRRQVLRDPRYYLMAPGLLSSSMIVTAFFFHHLNIAATKGWSSEWVTGTYILYAITGTITMLITGPLIDRFTAIKVTQFILIPLVASCLILANATHYLTVIPYMAMLGIHSALVLTAVSALWPELYGVRYLGAIKSLFMALMVLSSALGPVIMGILIDIGMSIGLICTLFGLYALAGNVLVVVALRMPSPFKNMSQTN